MTLSPGTWTTIVLLALLLAGGLVLLPLGLEALAARNRQRTRHFRRQLARRQARLQQLQAQLRPYDQLRSAVYRQLQSETTDLLTTVAATLRQLAAVNLVLPEVPRLLWPGGFFLRHPGTTVAIMRDWRRLRRANRQLQAAAQQSQQADDQLQRLASLPAELRRQAAAMANSLQPLATDIAGEQAILPANVGNLAGRQADLEAQTADIQNRLSAAAITAAEADTLANWLDTIAAAKSALADELAERQRRRQTFTRDQQAAANRLHDLEQALHPYHRLPLTTTVLQEAGSALAAAEQAATQATWPRSTALLARCNHWITLGDLLLPPLTAVAQLNALRETSLQPEAIDQLQNTLNRQITILHANLPDNAAPDSWQTFLANQGQSLDTITHEAQTLLNAYQADWQRQADAARKARRKLEQAWTAYQRELNPAADDRLRQQYSALQNRFAQPQDNPVAWLALAQSAQQTAGDIAVTTNYVAQRRQQIDEMQRTIHAWVDEAEGLAKPWRCLETEWRTVQETAVFLQQFGVQQRQAKRLAELHALFDRAKQSWLDAQDALDTLRRQGERLHTIYTRIIRTRQTADSHVDSLAGHSEREAVLQQVIDDHLADALQANQIDDAIHALNRAESYLEKLF